MAAITFQIDDFNLTSSWTVSRVTTLDEWGNDQNDLAWSTPTTAAKTFTVDTSLIPDNAKITSAVFSGSTNGRGESYATANGVKKNITNAFCVDVSNWFSGVPDALQIKFTYQSFILYDDPYLSRGTHSTVSALKNLALTVNYEVEEEEPGGTVTTINIPGGECFLC